jgi:hypothetical protein
MQLFLLLVSRDDELEKKFEEAIHRTKELVTKYQNSEARSAHQKFASYDKSAIN